MARKPNTLSVIRALFAKSGNTCAFPGCTHPLVNERNLFIAQVCHIEAAEPGGPRYNPNATDEDRRAFENLVLMCYRHHRETDDAEEYPVERLKGIKLAHESSHLGDPFKVDAEHLYKLAAEMDRYWAEISAMSAFELENREMAMDVDVKATLVDLIAEVHIVIDAIEETFDMLSASMDRLPHDLLAFIRSIGLDDAAVDAVPYYENPFFHREWAFRNIRSPNLMKRLRLDLCHLEVKMLEAHLAVHPSDVTARSRMALSQDHLRRLLRTTTMHD